MTTQLNDTRRNEFFARVDALGEAEGQGVKSRPDFAVGMFLAAADQLIVSNIKEADKDDVKTLVANYFKARAKHGRAEKPDSITQQESKLRSFPNIGSMPAFRSSRNGGNTIAADWIKLVQNRIEILSDALDENLPLLDKMTLVNTAQKKKFETGSEAPLTADEIDAAIAPKAKDLSELKDLKAVEKRLEKIRKDWPTASHAVAMAIAGISPRMAELAGVEKAQSMKATLAGMTPEQLSLVGIVALPPTPTPTPEPKAEAPTETPTEAPTDAEAEKPKAPRRSRRKANGLDELKDLVANA